MLYLPNSATRSKPGAWYSGTPALALRFCVVSPVLRVGQRRSIERRAARMARMSTREKHAPVGRIASQAAYLRIRGLVLDGALGPGERILEERMAAELGISRTPVREALARLQSDGFLESEGSRGLTVRHYTVADVRDIYDLRAVLEGHVAALAAERATRVDVRRMQEGNTRMRAAIERWQPAAQHGQSVGEVRLLHEAVVTASRSPRAAMLLRSVVEIPLVLRAASCYTSEQLWRSYDDHVRIAAAIEAREVHRAEMLMAEHVLQTRDVVLAELARRQAASRSDSAS